MERIIVGWILMGLGGAVVAAAHRLPGPRGTSLAMSALLAGVAGLWLSVATHPPQEVALLVGRPFSVFQTAWVFRLTRESWAQGWGVLTAGLLVGLMWTAYPGQGRLWPRILALALVGAATGAALAADLFTLLMAWALLDVAFLALLLIRWGEAVVERAVLAGLVNGAALLGLWAAAVRLWWTGDSLFWSRMAGAAALPLLLLAGLIRLDIYPFHVGRPPELADEVDWAALLYVVPTAVGLMLWARLIPLLQGWGGTPGVALLLGLTSLLGGLWAWAEPDPRAGLVAAAWGTAAWWALAGLARPEMAPLAAALWPVCFALLFVGPSFVPPSPWGLPALGALLTLAGLPLTPGATLGTAVFHAWPAWAWPFLVLLQGLLVGALLRGWLRPPEQSPSPPAPWALLYGVGLGIGVLSLIGLGIALNAWGPMPLPFRLALLAGAGVGLLLYAQADRVHAVAWRWARVRPFLSLEWLYAGLAQAIHSPAEGLRRALAFISHPAVMWLWALVIAGLLLVFWQGSPR